MGMPQVAHCIVAAIPFCALLDSSVCPSCNLPSYAHFSPSPPCFPLYIYIYMYINLAYCSSCLVDERHRTVRSCPLPRTLFLSLFLNSLCAHLAQRLQRVVVVVKGKKEA